MRWSGIPISFRIFQFVVIHTVKGLAQSIKQKQMFFWNSLAFDNKGSLARTSQNSVRKSKQSIDLIVKILEKIVNQKK